MITSVTSASAAATSAIASWGVALGAGGAILVIGLLIAMEFLGATQGPRLHGVRKLLLITTGPLVLVLMVNIVAKAMATLGGQT